MSSFKITEYLKSNFFQSYVINLIFAKIGNNQNTKDSTKFYKQKLFFLFYLFKHSKNLKDTLINDKNNFNDNLILLHKNIKTNDLIKIKRSIQN